MIGLHDKVKEVLITGASRGIGLQVALSLLHAGCRVYCVSRSPSNHAHDNLHHIPADLASGVDSGAEICALLEERGVFPDTLILCAGAITEALIPKQDPPSIMNQLNVNFVAHVELVRRLIPHMMRHRFGRIVGVSSTAARQPAPGQSLYAASKAGLEAFLRCCAMEFARKGITCNSVAPGYVATEFSARLEATKDLSKVVPVGRIANVQEAADAVLFFLGRHSDYVTGTTLTMDGGLSLAIK